MISPACVRSSSPTIDAAGQAAPPARRAPSIALWSVMHKHVDARRDDRLLELVGRRRGVARPHRVGVEVDPHPPGAHGSREVRMALDAPPAVGLTPSVTSRSSVTSRMTRLTPAAPHRQPLDVAADRDDVVQHPLQRRGDRELAHRLGRARRRGSCRPSAPVEKSPLTGLTPECRPVTDWTSTPSPTCGDQLGLRPRCPGTSDSAQAADAGRDLKPPRTAIRSTRCPTRRAV